MKKLLLTIWAAIQIGLLIGSNLAFANTPLEREVQASEAQINNVLAAFEGIISKPCLKNDIYSQKAEDKTDLEYVIEIIREPLDFDLVTAGSNEDFQIRRCYDNTLQFSYISSDGKNTKKFETMNFLAAKPENGSGCSQTAQELSKQPPAGMDVRYSCQEVQVILSKGGPTGFYYYISMIWRFGMSIGGLVSVVVIILSGIQISASGGNQEAINQSKARIIKSLLGLAVLILSGLILNTINPIFFRE
jgi:hypothetical protein